MMVKNRVLREKEWHNQTFGTNIRSSMRKFYSININKNKIFKELVYNELDRNNIMLLDYGCGTGNSLIGICDKISSGIGIDISEARIEKAKSLAKDKGIKNLDFFVMDATNTVFPNETFDIICGSAILHHLDLESSLNELKRILKPTGKCFFQEPLNTNPFIFLYRKLTPFARTKDEQPLGRKDIKIIRTVFPNMEISYYSFCTLFAVLFRKSKHFSNIVKILFFIDEIILNKRSLLKWLAWVCILTLRK
jgi:ubiquinone/menaquinone biosynthesis C-methylase UbiE